jgi:hypothetical protein
MHRAGGVGTIVLVLLSAAVLHGGQALTRTEADSMQRKLSAILTRGETPVGARGARTAPVRTSFTQREINAYLRYDGQPHIPVGVVDPQLTIAGPDRLEGHAFVDLDAVRKSKERSVLDPLAYVGGTMELRAIGALRTAKGMATFDLQSATLGGVAIPRSLLEELVAYYSRTPDMPEGFHIDKPFALPANIQAIEFQSGSATVIQ